MFPSNMISFKITNLSLTDYKPKMSLTNCLILLSYFQHINANKQLMQRFNDCKNLPNSYYDTAQLKCVSCDNYGIVSDDGLNCKCPFSSKTVQFFGSPQSLVCKPCDDGMVSTSDGYGCVDPAPSCLTKDKATFDRNQFGAVFREKCSDCRGNTSVDISSNICKPCNAGLLGDSCQCLDPMIQTGGICVPPGKLQQDKSSMYEVSYEGGGAVESYVIKQDLRAVEYLCRIHKNVTACQTLSNFCVITIYDENSLKPCGLLETIEKQRGSTSSLPVLYHMESDFKGDELYFASGNEKSGPRKLSVVAAIYTLNGTFVGLKSVVGGLLQLCKAETNIMNAAFKFGRLYEQKCKIGIQELMDTDLRFFDLYFEQEDSNKKRYLWPILINNYNIVRNGRRINLENIENTKKWKLTRRFMLVDSVSGRKDSNSEPTFVRYASMIKFVVEMGDKKNGGFYLPYMIIEYKDITLETIKKDRNMEVEVQFETQYYASTERYEKDLEITMGVLCSIGALWACLRTWSWTRRSGLKNVDFLTVLKFVVFLASTISNIFLIVMLSTALWLLVFYKEQLTVIYVLPYKDQEYSFLVYVGLAAALKSIEMVHLLVEQLTTRVFFLDWERPRGHVIPKTIESGAPKQTTAPITIWRTYLVANEFNELQATRKTSTVLQLILMLFFLKVVNFEALTIVEPGSSLDYVPTEFVDSKMSRFAVIAGLYLLIASVQWFISAIIMEPLILDRFHNFADLCSIANVSVLMMRHSQFGYYIHGRSVHGHADTNMREMNEMLERERENLCSQRGLEPNSEQQCFIVCLPNRFKEMYDRVLNPITGFGIPQTRVEDGGGVDKLTVRMESVIQVYEEMNQFLTSFIDHCIPQADYLVRDRRLLECIFDMEFQAFNEKGIFYNDKSDQGFTALYLYGHEWTLVTFELLWFCIIDMASHNVLVSVVVVFIIHKLITAFRDFGGTKNLTRTSLVDERFLI